MSSTVETLLGLLRSPSSSPGPSSPVPSPSSLVPHPSPNQKPETTNQELTWPDWNAVVDTAVRNNLTPLLFKRLKQNGARAFVPADAWDRLRQAYFDSARKNMHLYRELRPILRCLRNAGIPVIVLKGAFLAEAVYGEVAFRPMCDIDLMVPRAELSKAQMALLDAGGTQTLPTGNEFFWQEHHHPPATSIRGLSIELHWTIADPAEEVWIDPTGLWDRARPATIAGAEVMALSPEDLLLHLCIHFGCSHHLKGLLPLCDIERTIRVYRNQMDWAKVADLAREWRVARYVGLALALSRSLLNAVVPDDALERLVSGGIDKHVLEMARQAVLAETGYTPWSSVSGLLGARTLGDKAKMLWKRVFISRDEMGRVYPKSSGSRFLGRYYALRLRDAMRDRGATALKLASSPEYAQSELESTAVANWLRSG